MGNAIKFTDQGEVTVAVECTHRDACSAGLHFTVSDTGIGIPQDQLGLIFEAFTQTDSSMSRRFGGTGLGLAISAQLIELMDGRIWVESEEGAGSCFHFCVRFALAEGPPGSPADAPADSTEPLAALAAVDEQVRPAGRLPRVLIADDNRANRHLVSKILQGRAAQLSEAESGERVLELVRKQPFDIILLDVQMPGMDGLETAAAIRQLESESHRRPHIIAMTAHALRADRQRCLAAGMDAYIAKPLRAQNCSPWSRKSPRHGAARAGPAHNRRPAPNSRRR